MKLDPCLILLTKVNSKWIKDFNIRSKPVKLLEENIEGKLLDIDLGSDFLNMTPKAHARKAKINKCNYMKLKSFHTLKERVNKMKKQPMEWEKNVKPCI